MFRNYFKTAFRNLIKNKFYTILNIFGLAVGLATCLLILLYVIDEKSFDLYNKNVSRIYRLNNEIKFGNNYVDVAQVSAPVGPSAVIEIPSVEQYTRIKWYGGFLLKKGNENIKESRVGYADSTLFKVFTLPVIAGDFRTALRDYHSIVLTESMAKKYFNSTDIVGKQLLVNDTGNYKITAVIKDIPAQSHFNFDFFIPLLEDLSTREDNWLSQNWNTYILVKENTNVKTLESELNKMLDRHVGPQIKTILNLTPEEFKRSGGFVRCSITPLADIHLRSNKTGELNANGNIQFVYIFSAIAIFILLIACVNFMNLSTARSASRSKEVGIRKVLGSLKMNLIQQFLAESMLISFISMILSLLIVLASLSFFNTVTGKQISFWYLFHPGMLLAFAILVFLVGLISGSYPAFFLSSFQPVAVLKGKLASGFKKSWLRNSLVIFQFVVSIVLIVGTFVIYKQLNYIRTKDVGFDRNKVVVIENTDALKDKANTFRNELMQISGVQNATMSGYLPVNFSRSNDAFFTSTALDQSSAISMQNWNVDENYIPTLDLKIIAGRNFSPQMGTDSSALIINEAAAKFLGVKEILNKKLYRIDDMQTKKLINYHIIGVVKNFNFSSLREVVTPLCLILHPDNGNISHA